MSSASLDSSLSPAHGAARVRPARSITKAALAARVVLGTALVTWLALLWAMRDVPVYPWWAELVLHGAEGAMVGALCDWWAVSKVYSQARLNFDTLVTQVSSVVVRDMIRLKELLGTPGTSLRQKLDSPEAVALVRGWLREHVASKDVVHAALSSVWRTRLREPLVSWLVGLDVRAAVFGRAHSPGLLSQPAVRGAVERCLRAALDSPERARRLRQLLCELGRHVTVAELSGIGSRAEARRVLRALYDTHAREHTVRWLATVDLRGALRVQGSSQGLLREQAIRGVVAHCVRHAARDPERTRRLHDAIIEAVGSKVITSILGVKITVQNVADWFLSPEKLHEHVASVATIIEQPPTQSSGRLQQIGQEYAVAYLDGWHDLSESERHRAAELIHDFVLPQVLDSVADASFDALRDMPVERILQAVVTEQLMHRRLLQLADFFAQSSASEDPRWANAAREYAGAWLDAWHALPEPVRRRAAGELADLAGPWAVDAAAEWAWTQRQEIDRATWAGRLSDLSVVRSLVELVEQLSSGVGDVEARAEQALSDRLRSMGGDGFVDMLEERTRPKLDMIQVNGAVLGLVLGAFAGLVPMLLSAVGR